MFLFGLMMMAAVTTGAAACNKGEETETATRSFCYDFEQTILP